MATRPTTGTYPLNELGDFTVAEGAPDPRGWAVYTSAQQQLGTVEDLLVDLDTMVVRYLEVRIVGGAAATTRAPDHVLLPVGLARTVDDQRRVLVDVTAEQVAGLPAYARGGVVRREYEDALLRGLAASAAPVAGDPVAGDPVAGNMAQAGPRYYERPEFDTARFYGRPRGRADAAPGPDAAPGADGDVRVVAYAEEPVVTTRLVVKEILVIKRRRVVENQVIEVDLRSERVDVDRTGGARGGVAADKPRPEPGAR